LRCKSHIYEGFRQSHGRALAVGAGFSLTQQQFCSTMIGRNPTPLLEITMSEVPHDGGSPVVRNVLMVLAVVYLIGTVIFMVQAQGRINDLEKKQAAAQTELVKKMTESNAQMKAQLNVLADRAGMNHKELSKKAQELQAKELETATRLKVDEETTKQQIGAVTSDVNGVKGEVVKVSADVTDTKNDLAVTKGKLDHAIGDLNKHSELIATSHDELEMLKHRGDRDYFEFTLHKEKTPTHLSIVSLQLKKTDPKKSKFTLYVLAEDKKIEKKDRTINEPLQFYTGRDRALFEVVVNTVDKNTVTGYLSTPKNVATTQMPSHAPSSQ
jgi:FlaG/FlaF family flagellin (archaellin)